MPWWLDNTCNIQMLLLKWALISLYLKCWATPQWLGIYSYCSERRLCFDCSRRNSWRLQSFCPCWGDIWGNALNALGSEWIVCAVRGRQAKKLNCVSQANANGCGMKGSGNFIIVETNFSKMIYLWLAIQMILCMVYRVKIRVCNSKDWIYLLWQCLTTFS